MTTAITTTEDRIAALNDILEDNGAGFTAEFTKNYKDNKIRDAIALRSEEYNCAPVIYMDPELESMDDSELAEHLIKMFKDEAKNICINDLINRENVLKTVQPKLVSGTNIPAFNEKHIPFVKFEDLIIYFTIPVPDSIDKNASVQVNHSIMQNLGLSTDELLPIALENMSHVATVNGLINVIADLLGSAPADASAEKPMLVVSNESKISGAAAILCKSVQERIASMIGEKYAILPSSVHEVICVAYKTDEELDYLKNTVREINETEVDEGERLSNNVYIHMKDTIKLYA